MERNKTHLKSTFELPAIKKKPAILKTQHDSGIQAIIFHKNTWTEATAQQWLEEHKYSPIKKVHITPNYLRYRLLPPSRFAGYFSKPLGNGIVLVVGYTLI